MNAAHLIPTRPLHRVAVAAGAAIGIAAAVDIGRYVAGRNAPEGDTPPQTLTGTVVHQRHMAWTTAVTAITHPERAVAVVRSGIDALQSEALLFPNYRAGHDDNGIDAFRHTYGLALMTQRLIDECLMAPREAAALARRFGMAHEDDSATRGAHYRNARTMDEHNNEVGIAIGTAMSGAGHVAHPEVAIARAVLDAMRGGRTLIMDAPTSAPRATTPDDVAVAMRPLDSPGAAPADGALPAP